MSSGPFRVVEHVVPGEHIREYPAATANEQEEPLYLAVKQYIPLDNPNPHPGDITVIGAHANGFPKVRYLVLSYRITELTLVFVCIGTLRTSLGRTLRSFESQRIPH